MDRYLSPIIFAADFDGAEAPTHAAFESTTAREMGFKEDWLQRAIAHNPELVIAACREADLTDEEWIFWAREFPVESAGNIDILLVSESGRVAIIETKLSYNPEGRRSVVAQTLEYAIHLPVVSRLPPLPEAKGQPFVDLDTVQSRIQEGDYLLVITGDRLDSRAVKLGQSLLGQHLVRGWELALVEVGVFRKTPDDGSRNGLLVPHLRGAIVAERRQVVQITIEGDRTRVDVKPLVPVAAAAKTQNLTRVEFFEKLSAEFQSFAAELLSLEEKHPSVALRFGKAALIFDAAGKNILELYLDGRIKFRAWDFDRDLGQEISLYYQEKLGQLFPRAMKSYTSNEKIDAQRTGPLLALLDEIIRKTNPSSLQRDI